MAEEKGRILMAEEKESLRHAPNNELDLNNGFSISSFIFPLRFAL